MKKYVALLTVFVFGAISVVDLLHPGFAVTHDGQDHIARIANFYLNLQEGVFIPRWAPNLNWGYGHPILEFLYPLPSYIASLFHFLGFSLIDSTKLVFALAEIASGISMYLFVRKLWGKGPGVISGILYMYAPYHFVDLYVRGDIGEQVAFVFIPLVFLGLYLLSERQTIGRILFVSISLAFLILSHNAIALILVPLIFLYALFLFWGKKWSKSFGIYMLIAGILGFLLSAFFWFPALLEGQYTLRNIVTKGEYIHSFVSIGQFVYGQWSYTGMFTMQLGILHWVFFLSSFFFLFTYKFKKKNMTIVVFLSGLILYTICALFLMLPISNFLWQRIMMLQNFQFPWRFLAVPVFTTSLLGGFCLSRVPSRYANATAVGFCILLLFLSKDYMHAKSYAQKPETFFTGIYNGTTDTGESAPIWSVRFMLQNFDKPLETINGNTQIVDERRLATEHSYTVSSQGTSRLLENTLYFPGWRVLVDGVAVPVQFQDPEYRGLMTFSVADGTHSIDVVYQESKLRLTGDILSLIGIVGLLSLFLFKKKIRNL